MTGSDVAKTLLGFLLWKIDEMFSSYCLTQRDAYNSGMKFMTKHKRKEEKKGSNQRFLSSTPWWIV